jgi:flavin reductase (DIM6/NTAB) family NADH-FMN oxidoreductase RutF
MHLTKQQIIDTDRIKRLNLINAISGIKPANLIGSISKTGKTNLAIFSHFVHLKSNPPLMGYISRPEDEVVRDTLNNIRNTGFFTVNHVHESFIDKAHQTSAKYNSEISEFEACDLTPEFIGDFKAPFVKESIIKIGLKFKEILHIDISDNMMIIGEIECIHLPEELLDENFYLDLEKSQSVGISGLNSYFKLKKIKSLPYARP